MYSDDDEELPAVGSEAFMREAQPKNKPRDLDPEEEEDEEEEEEDAGRDHKRKRSKHRHKRSAASRFLDIEAEVSDEDDEPEEDEDEDAGGFIDGDDDEDAGAGRRHHALLDAQRTFEQEDRSPEQIAKDLSARYNGRTAVRYTGDMNEIPQRLLMPSVHDASLWQVRVKPGRERDIVFSLMRKSIDLEYSAHPLQIISAFERDTLPGMIYIEATSSQQVLQACNGLVGVYPSRGVQLVPIEEMASLLQIKKKDVVVTPGSWVRLKRGLYQGDLAQVIDINDDGESVGLKLIPRIDLNPRDDASIGGVKRKRTTATSGAMRPPQRLFNFEEVAKAYGRSGINKRNHYYVLSGETYNQGFLEKDFKLSWCSLEDVNPSLDEITQFSRRQDGDDESAVDLSVIAEASRKAAVSVLQPGDHIEVFEGEQAGLQGVVEEISQEVVTIVASGVDLEGQKVDVPARSVRKRFKPGDHVKVMAGKNADETGLVVSVSENVVTFISDMSMQEVAVFSKDLREAAEVGSGTNIVGNYELHDLVQLDLQTVGVIFKTERDSFRVLDQNGQIRLVQPHQISMRRDSTRAVATDSEGHELRINDNMKEVDGEGRKGRVLHIHQSFFAFLHNRDITENGGVFVARARSLASVAPKGTKTPVTDLSKMNPTLMPPPSGGMVGSGNMGRGPRDRSIGLSVIVTKGPHKGYRGIIKDTNGTIARVELNTGNKLISIDKEKLHFPNEQPTGRRPTFDLSSLSADVTQNIPVMRNSNPYNSGGRTPGWGASGAADSRTPAWNTKTPNPYGNNAQTPAWNASSRTPNPYADSSRTPAWNAGSRTPNPYASGQNAGGATPARTWSGATPARPAWPAENAGWSGATPARPAWPEQPSWATPRHSGWGSGDNAWSAPTPGATAETPAFNLATPAGLTPGYFAGSLSAATPGITPGVVHGADLLGADPVDDAYQIPMDWIIDAALSKVQNRLKVRIEGSNVDGYLDGKFENREGRIMGAHKVGANFDQTAMVEFDEGEARTILAKYILPVHPSAKGQEVVVLHGKLKGEVVKIYDMETNTVTVNNMTSWYEIPRNECCIVTPPIT
ncbi:transcription elongation factor SPT5 [Mycena floridula]|nr:transcription elongation factor SPT5 [Mycena floridula]